MKYENPIRKEDLKGIQMPGHIEVLLLLCRFMVQQGVFETVLLPPYAKVFNISHFHY